MKIENRIHLKNRFPIVYTLVSQFETEQLSRNLVVEEAKSGDKTIFLQEPYNIYLHSKYNPVREAEQIMQQYDLTNIPHVYLIGLGLGYHIDYLVKTYPHIEISVFEPNIEVLVSYLELKKLPSHVKNLFVDFNESDNKQEITRLFSQKTMTIELPVYGKVYNDEIMTTQKKIKEYLNNFEGSLSVDAVFQESWVANSFINYPEIISTPAFLSEYNKGVFKNKPAIVVAAGPSLNDELELLKEITEERSAYVFAVGSAINTLLAYGIKPDAVFAYDPEKVQNEVLSNAKDTGNIPLIFGSTLGFSDIQYYKANKQHFILSKDVVAKHILNIPSDSVIADAPSIATVALMLMKKMEMNPVILVGQNLGYLDNQEYAQGIQYSFISNNELSDAELKKRPIVNDVYGNPMFTNHGFIKMKESIELIIKLFSNGKTINTTKKGAHIEGTEFLELQHVREMYLKEMDIVDDRWLNNQTQYDGAILAYNKLVEDFKRYTILLKDILPLANEMKKDFDEAKYILVSKNIDRFTKKFRVIVEHPIHEKILQIGIKVQRERFAKMYKEVEYEVNSKKKAQKFIDIFYNYFGSIYDFTSRLYPVVLGIQHNINLEENTIEGKN